MGLYFPLSIILYHHLPLKLSVKGSGNGLDLGGVLYMPFAAVDTVDRVHTSSIPRCRLKVPWST